MKFRAYDNVGNAESTKTQSVDVDTVAPVTSIKCNGKACSSGWHDAAVKVTLAATDSGSGVAAIHYTTDGSTPTLASPVYGAPFTLSTSKDVKYRAVDNVGNLGAVKTTLVRIDTGRPEGRDRISGQGRLGDRHGQGDGARLRQPLRRREGQLPHRRQVRHRRHQEGVRVRVEHDERGEGQGTG